MGGDLEFAASTYSGLHILMIYGLMIGWNGWDIEILNGLDGLNVIPLCFCSPSIKCSITIHPDISCSRSYWHVLV